MKIDRRQYLALLVASAVASASAKTRETETWKTDAGRLIDVDIWRPSGKPVARIHFSHGAASAPRKYENLLAPLCAAGYEIFAPLHVDSTEHPSTDKFKGMTSWMARLEDMRALSLVDDSSYIAMGHSYGALTSLALGGARPVVPDKSVGSLRDARVKAVVALSPPGPIAGFVDARAYSSLEVPALVQTGDRDVPIGLVGARWQDHLVAYDAAAADGSRYALVLEGVDHYFGSAICRPELPVPPQLSMLSQTIDVIDLFLRAHGLDDGEKVRLSIDRLSAKLAADGAVRLSRK